MNELRVVTVLPGDVEPGDLWRVVSRDQETSAVTFERVQAEPDQFRRRGDGLHPRVPPSVGARPITAEEAQELCAEMDRAMLAIGQQWADRAWSAVTPSPKGDS